MIVCGTGHRPNKLTWHGFSGYSDEVKAHGIQVATKYLTDFKATKVISGVALGWDTWLAIAAIRMSLPLVAAVPFVGQEGKWPAQSQDLYRRILARAEVKIVCQGGYSAEKMQIRNEWMVDNCQLVIALWNETPGGTANCVEYARKKHTPIANAWAEFSK